MKHILTILLLLCSLSVFSQNASFTRNRKPKTTAPAAPKQQTQQKQTAPFAIPKAPVAKPQAKTKQQAAKPKQQQTASKQKQAAKPKQPSISAPSGYENGHGYVDLGLSVKWATMNVGASSPTDYGDYYAWGVTRTKSTYYWSNYKWCKRSYATMTKYCTESDYGNVDNRTTLDLSDDAAYVNWGGSWRMPTRAEQDELREKCTWTWTTQNGVKGYKVSSKRNSNSIFLPAAGYRYDGDLRYAGSLGYYWSSSLNSSSSNGAYVLFFDSGDVYRYNDYRFIGFSVRGVCP